MRSIILIRHGRPSHEEPRWLNARDAARWLELYDHSGIAKGDIPPADLLEFASTANIIVSSDLPRAHQSANILAGGRDVVVTPMLRESRMRPLWLPVRMPVGWWRVAIVARWLFSMAYGGSSATYELHRSREAVRWLIRLSHQNNTVVVVTHNAFRFLLLHRLRLNGWVNVSRVRCLNHWSAWTLRRLL